MRDDALMLAHQVVGPSELAGSWTFEPVLMITLALAALAYGRGRARLGRRIARTDRRRAFAFYGGLLVMGAALVSPLDALASTLFSGHMVQHLVLMLVAAPLLVHARPTATLVAGLPEGARDVVRRAGLRGPNAQSRLRGTAHALGSPMVVWIVGALALWAWHMPALYEAALSHDAVHVAQHASFLGAALLFWNVVLASGARRGVPRPIAIVLVFASGVQSSALGAVLLFASTPLYTVHGAGARVWDVSPLADQQLAGALMWSPPAFLYIVVMGWLLVRWFAEMDDAVPDQLVVAAAPALSEPVGGERA